MASRREKGCEVLGEGIRVAVAPDSERFCKVEGHGQVLICAKLIPDESPSLLTIYIANLYLPLSLKVR